jgi:tRNA 2-thiouridine synthesizing protein A
MDTIDARGLSCPQPVILTQKAVSEGKKNFEVIVDSEVCLENVTRFIKGKFKVEPAVRKDGDSTVISVKIR